MENYLLGFSGEDMEEKVTVTEITVKMHEGYSELMDVPHTFTSFADADKLLNTWSTEATTLNTWFTARFSVVLSDNSIYSGEFMLEGNQVSIQQRMISTARNVAKRAELQSLYRITQEQANQAVSVYEHL